MYWWPPFVLTNAVFHPKFINIKTIKVRKSKNCLYHYVIWSAFYSLFSTRQKHEELILCLLLLDCVIFPICSHQEHFCFVITISYECLEIFTNGMSLLTEMRIPFPLPSRTRVIILFSISPSKTKSILSTPSEKK